MKSVMIVLVVVFVTFSYAFSFHGTNAGEAHIASVMIGNAADIGNPSFMNTNPVTSAAFAVANDFLTAAEYSALKTRALDVFANTYELTNCAQNTTAADAIGEPWGYCDNAVIMHIHVPLDVYGNSMYGPVKFQWDGVAYSNCRLEVARQLDVLFMAVALSEYTLTGGKVIPAGQSLPVGNYQFDCIKKGCSANSQFEDKIVVEYEQSTEGIGGPGGAFLCDATSASLLDPVSGERVLGQIIGVVPLQVAGVGPNQDEVGIYTGAQSFFPKPFSG